jgi:hypothetical protein
MYARAFRGERMVHLLAGHEAAFAWFGGSPRELLYDNPRTMVKGRDPVSGEVEMNGTFKDFVAHYGVRPRFCHPYRARTQGKIESGIKYLKKNFLAGRRFRDLDELNQQIEEWLTEADVRSTGPLASVPSIASRRTRRSCPRSSLSPRARPSGKCPTMRGCASRRTATCPRFIRRQIEIRLHGDLVLLLQDG